MLKAFGVTHVILGHSERRHIFHETDELINKKVLRPQLHHRMTPILCVGETQENTKRPARSKSCCASCSAGSTAVGDRSRDQVVIAYEPVWAIGTGHTATPEQAQSVHGAIREAILERYGRRARGCGPDNLWRQRQRREC